VSAGACRFIHEEHSSDVDWPAVSRKDPAAAVHLVLGKQAMDDAMHSESEQAKFLALAHMARTRAFDALMEML
jgi:hypothetical protein